MSEPSAARLLSGLTDRQRQAVTSDAGVLCVVAGAGSGKTTVLTRRVAWRVETGAAAAEHVLVVTFSRRAAVELRQRLRRLGTGEVTAATFHAAALAQLRRHWADRGQAAPVVLSDPHSLLRRILEKTTGNGEPSFVAAVLAELTWARARALRPADYPEASRRASRTPPLELDQMVELFGLYQAEKRKRNVLDLDDLVERCAELLESESPTAHAVRWSAQHLFVDEFQDVNPAQWRLLEAWRDGRPDLCVVGDPRQAIYAWNGSDPSLLERLPTLVPGAVTVRLDENHRSSPQIVSAASAVLSASGDSEHAPVSRQDDRMPPVVTGFEDEEAEAAATARWLRTTRRPGQPWRHCAVLARTHARLEPAERALHAEGVPSRRAGNRGRAPALSEILRVLRRAAPGAGAKSALVDALAETTETAGSTEEAAALEEAGAHLGRLVDDHGVEEPRPTVGSFLAWLAANRGGTEVAGWERQGAGSSELGDDAVTLATFHQAKGLEWPMVAVVGLETGTMPIAYAVGEEAQAEERRLLYVALTRAESELWCSWAAQSSDGAAPPRPRGPSPLLEPVRQVIEAQAPLGPRDALARLDHVRRRLAAAG